MSIFIIILMVVAVIFAVALIWKNREDFSEQALEEPPEDIRVSPLLRGINYLLSDKPDRALQEMVQVAKIRSESAEVYMALGEMFRSQGEYGRAVRIHQNILARPDVATELHFQAYVALGKDFQAGGLLDRALKHYAKALAIQTDHLPSLYACLRIREQSLEWDEAEWLVSRLEQVENEPYHEHRAYLKAEMAKNALEKGDASLSESLVLEALKLSPSCTHAYLLLIHQLLQTGETDEVIHQASLFLDRVKVDHHNLLPEALLSNEAFYQTKGEAFLWDMWQQRHDVEVGVRWIENVSQTYGLDAAHALRHQLNFSDLSLRHELRLAALDEANSNLVQQAKYWRLSMKLYACKHCGVQVHQMRWHCPKCNKWGTMEPLQGSHVFGEEQHAI
ncbi:MAG: heat-shock protein [Ghiorsea sp.]|nr:heat-shock protein [Ghiorsea sp.]